MPLEEKHKNKNLDSKPNNLRTKKKKKKKKGWYSSTGTIRQGKKER